jgi:hypothetical protein
MGHIRNKETIDKWIFSTSYWDGPLEGIAEVNGKHYFLVIADEDIERNRMFWKYDPPEWIWSIIKVDKYLFETYVGCHMSNDKEDISMEDTRDIESINYYFNYLKSTKPTENRMKSEWYTGDVYEFVVGDEWQEEE